MKAYRAGEVAKPGLYLNPRQLSFRSVDEEGALPGKGDESYRRVPVLLLLVMGPLLGLAYAVFLPFIGFAVVAWLLGTKTVHLARGTARTAVRVLRPGWEPSMAFLSRSKPSASEGETAGEAPDEWAESVRKRLDPPDRNAA